MPYHGQKLPLSYMVFPGTYRILTPVVVHHVPLWKQAKMTCTHMCEHFLAGWSLKMRTANQRKRDRKGGAK